MQRLLDAPEEARALGNAARRTAQARFNIERFAAEWDRALRSVAQ